MFASLKDTIGLHEFLIPLLQCSFSFYKMCIKVQIAAKVLVYKIQVNPIHTILKYGDYYNFMDW